MLSTNLSEAMQSLLNVQEEILGELEPRKLMTRLAAEALYMVEGADGAGFELTSDDGYLTYAATVGTLDGEVGHRSKVSVGLSGTAITLGAVLRCNDTAKDPRVDHHRCDRLGVRSMLILPLIHEGKALGTLVMTAQRPLAFQNADVLTLQHLGGFIAASVYSASKMFETAEQALSQPSVLPRDEGPTIGLDTSDIIADDLPVLSSFTSFVAGSLGLKVFEYHERSAARQRIRKVLTNGGPTMVLQPIFDLEKQKVVGYEALARFKGDLQRSPHLWFAEASSVGLGLDLEVATVRSALKVLEQLPEDCYLSINLSPQGATSSRVVEMLREAPAARLVIEVTEHTVVQDYDQLNEALGKARDRGTRVAVDDAGAGYASMRHILRLKPDCIKLDIGLTSGIDNDPVRRALASSMISFAQEIGAVIVAEGIESQGEVDALRALGVTFGQGFYLGKPAPPKRARTRKKTRTPVGHPTTTTLST